MGGGNNKTNNNYYKIEFESIQNMHKFSSYFGIKEINDNEENNVNTFQYYQNRDNQNQSTIGNGKEKIHFQNDIRIPIKLVKDNMETISSGEIFFIRFNCCIKTKFKTFRSQVTQIRHFKHKSKEALSLIQISGKKLLIMFETSLQREQFSEYFIYLNKKFEESSSRKISFTIIYFDSSIMKKPGKGSLQMKGKYAIFKSKGQKSVKVDIENAMILVNSQQNETVTMLINNGDKRINFVMTQIQEVETLTQFIPLKEPITATQYYGMIIDTKLKKFKTGMKVKIHFENDFVSFSLFELKKSITKNLKSLNFLKLVETRIMQRQSN